MKLKGLSCQGFALRCVLGRRRGEKIGFDLWLVKFFHRPRTSVFVQHADVNVHILDSGLADWN